MSHWLITFGWDSSRFDPRRISVIINTWSSWQKSLDLWHPHFSPQNENLNLLARFKFLKFFYIVLLKTENLQVRTKFCWSWAGETGAHREDCYLFFFQSVLISSIVLYIYSVHLLFAFVSKPFQIILDSLSEYASLIQTVGIFTFFPPCFWPCSELALYNYFVSSSFDEVNALIYRY